ncbi:MAG: TatD family hydrolase [Crocinitomicaceae bacterium]|nr:TatD family hydrolase [Crocinitomicaceae bacterium]
MFINIHTHLLHHQDIEILNLEDAKELGSSFSAGIHPNQAHHLELDYDVLVKNSSHENCLAIGECGLDKIISTPFHVQTLVFKKQIELSERENLPLILHCVKAWNEVLLVKKEMKANQTWIFHGFRKTALLESVLENKLMVSIGTPLLYDLKLQEIFPKIPLEKLFLETDSDDRFSIEEVYKKAAELKGIPLAVLKNQILENFKRVFTKFKT